MSTRSVHDDLLLLVPNLRVFALSLCGDRDRADDLVQDTLLKAWKHLDAFEEGTNLRAWLFRILRNTFFSDLRRRRDILLLADLNLSPEYAVRPEQHGWLDSKDLQRALAKLNEEQRTAILLVGAEGFTYEEAAVICNCAVGTIKSRVSRARARLHELLGLDFSDPIQPVDEANSGRRRVTT